MRDAQQCVKVSDGKKTHWTSSDDGLIAIYDIRTWKELQIINTRNDQAVPVLDNEVKRISFDSNGSHLAAACSCGDVLVYDTSQCPAIACVLPGPRECTFDVAWGVCPQTHARILVSASHDHTCGYWLHGCLAGAPSSVSSASSSHTSKAVAFTSDTILDSMPRRRARSPSLDPKSKKPRLAPTFGCDDFTIVWQFTTCNASHDSDLATWISFDTQDSCRVERAFQEWNTLKDNPQDGGGKIHVERCSRVYEIDFSRMLQTSMQTRTIRKLRRFPLSAAAAEGGYPPPPGAAPGHSHLPNASSHGAAVLTLCCHILKT